MSNGPSLPDHPLLRRVAELLESHGYAGEVYDPEWRIVFMSSNYVATTDPEGGAPERFYGQSVIARTLGEERAVWGPDRPSQQAWAEAILPAMLHDVPPAIRRSTMSSVSSPTWRVGASPPSRSRSPTRRSPSSAALVR